MDIPPGEDRSNFRIKVFHQVIGIVVYRGNGIKICAGRPVVQVFILFGFGNITGMTKRFDFRDQLYSLTIRVISSVLLKELQSKLQSHSGQAY
jgi:hypothetical protein